MKTPFAIGSALWPGFSKFMEEVGEALQVVGKLIGTGGDTKHWDGAGDLGERLEEELGDVLGAAFFVIDKNPRLRRPLILLRSLRKQALFNKWHAEGVAERSTAEHWAGPAVPSVASAGRQLVSLAARDSDGADIAAELIDVALSRTPVDSAADAPVALDAVRELAPDIERGWCRWDGTCGGFGTYERYTCLRGGGYGWLLCCAKHLPRTAARERADLKALILKAGPQLAPGIGEVQNFVTVLLGRIDRDEHVGMAVRAEG